MCSAVGFGLCALFQMVHTAGIKPLSIPPSLYWDGDDGRWSSFQIQVGDPGQTVRLFPGTSASAGSTIWVVIDAGCSGGSPTLVNCKGDRGNMFESNKSTTWSTERLEPGPDGIIYELNTYEELKVNRRGNGSYGFDVVRLGTPGSGLPTIEHQVVAGIWTNDFWLGSLELSPYPFNFTNLNDPQPSMLGTLRNNSLIPSSSWAYTAGAYYEEPPVFGSLTLGGYDATRFAPSNASFSFGADFSRDLLLSLRSVTYDTIGSSPLMASSIDVFINSMVPEIWLPVDVCKEFEEQFNLTWNEQGQLYLVDEDAHLSMLAQNPTFTFTLGQAGDVEGSETVEVVLPYAAFDLNLTAPIVGNTTRWFPLKQAQNSTQYTLGRTFLQEAYVIADYERKNFTVAQALFPPTSVSQSIVAIELPGGDDSHAESDLSAGARAGISAGIVVALLATIVALWFWRRRRRRATSGGSSAEEDRLEAENSWEDDRSSPGHRIDSGVVAVHEVDGQNWRRSELQADRASMPRHELATEEKPGEVAGVQADPRPVELDASPR